MGKMAHFSGNMASRFPLLSYCVDMGKEFKNQIASLLAYHIRPYRFVAWSKLDICRVRITTRSVFDYRFSYLRKKTTNSEANWFGEDAKGEKNIATA